MPPEHESSAVDEPDDFETLIKKAVVVIEDASKRLADQHDRFGTQIDSGEEDVKWRGLQLQIRVNATKLLQWQTLWFSQESRSPNFCLALWGQSGEAELKHHLENIIARACAIAVVDAAITDNSVAKKRNPRMSLGWLRPTKSPKPLGTKSHAETIVKAPETKLASLRHDVSQLAAQVEELSERAELLFRRLHAAFPGSDKLEEHLRGVLSTRKTSTVLYHFCQSQNMTVELDMNLLNNEDEIDKLTDLFDWWRDLKVTYRFLARAKSGSETSRRVILEPIDPKDHNMSGEGHLRPDENNDVHFSRLQPDSLIKLPDLSSVTNGFDEHHFHATSSELPLEAQGTDEGLPNTGQVSWKAPLTLLRWSSSIGSRASMAYRIVECGLFLLGTPWLSHLSFDNIRLAPSTTTGNHLILLVDQFETRQDSSSSSAAVERAHLSQIGVLLLEIALETRLDPEQLEIPFSGTERAIKVGETMGLPYQQACEFCLGPSDDTHLAKLSLALDSPEMRAEAILKVYYNEVFIRVRDAWHSLS